MQLLNYWSRVFTGTYTPVTIRFTMDLFAKTVKL
jgi:hypothetical protein